MGSLRYLLMCHKKQNCLLQPDFFIASLYVCVSLSAHVYACWRPLHNLHKFVSQGLTDKFRPVHWSSRAQSLTWPFDHREQSKSRFDVEKQNQTIERKKIFQSQSTNIMSFFLPILLVFAVISCQLVDVSRDFLIFFFLCSL